MSVYLGIDPGLATVGFGVVRKSGTTLEYLDSGIIQTSPELSLPERLCVIKDDLIELINTYKPVVVCVEELFFATNAKTAINVAQARGVIVETIARCRVPMLELTPLQLKQNIAGYGGADKLQIQEMTKRLLKLSRIPKPDDAADGLALAICAEQLYKVQKLVN